MTSPIGARIDLDKLDLDRVETREIVVTALEGVVLSSTVFGWGDDLTVCSTDPDRLEAFGEVFMLAARDLRVVLGITEDGDEISAFPKAVA